MASSALRAELDCSICLSTYTDPVMLRCGHNFCRLCIDRVLDTQDQSGVYSCPECREEFQVRPVLMRNITLRNIMENLLSSQPTQTQTGIFCTYCVDSPVPAVKSCLHCEASLCDKHLKVHSKSPEHVLCDSSTNLEKRKCSVHKELLKYYCTNDATCICVSCSLAGEHRGHRVEMLDEASEKKKKKLRNVLQKLITKREETEERVQSLEESRRKAQEKASGEAERVTALFIDIRRRLDDLEKKILSEISRQEKEESLSLSAVIQKLEIKKAELSMKMRHMEELCNMTDPLTVLQEPDTGDLCDPEEGGGDEDTGGHDRQRHDGDDRDVAVISDTLHTLCDIISGIRSGIYVAAPTDILLDVNTANNSVHISDDLKTATWTREEQNRPETAERFQDYSQVISRRGFTSGRHYWDVEGSRSGGWMVGMCYPSIDRRGRQSYIGCNNKSWSLYRYNTQHSVIHDSKEIQLPDKISSDRFRICLDYEAGQLSFYELCDPIRHLHTFTATFTEPLHAVLCVWEGSIKILGGGSNWEKPSYPTWRPQNKHTKGNVNVLQVGEGEMSCDISRGRFVIAQDRGLMLQHEFYLHALIYVFSGHSQRTQRLSPYKYTSYSYHTGRNQNEVPGIQINLQEVNNQSLHDISTNNALGTCILEDLIKFGLEFRYPTSKFKAELDQILQDACAQGIISADIMQGLVVDFPKIATLYLLPKIHKNCNIPPGRPIVSGIGSLCENICRFVDFYLQKCVETLPSFIRDTSDTLRHLDGLQLDPGTILVTCDVESLYTSICHDHGDRPFLQLQGTAMGATCAPSYANLFLGLWEREVLPFIPGFDAVLQWSSPEGFISTDVFRKKTSTNALLHASSSHYYKIKQAIPTGQFLRLKRICSSDFQFEEQAADLMNRFRARGYSNKDIKKGYLRAKHTPLSSLLVSKKIQKFRGWLLLVPEVKLLCKCWQGSKRTSLPRPALDKPVSGPTPPPRVTNECFVSLFLPSAMASSALRAELDCSICLSTYTDPVMLRCGHNFCRDCIDRVLDTQDQSGDYSCPECREEFPERPVLMRNLSRNEQVCPNLALRNIMENLLSTQPTQTETGIFCTYCVDSPVPAVKSCLLCEASLCDKHLRVHSKSPEHVLCDPGTDLEKRKCSVHKKILEYYCTEDTACICVSCSLAGEHRGHRVEMLNEASEKKKKKTLRNVLQKLITKRKETEQRVQSLEVNRRKAQEKASGEAERVTALFTDIRRRLDDLEKKVLSEISRQEEQRSLSLSAVIQKLEIKKAELSMKMRHIEELCNMTDPLTVLQEPDTGDLCDPEEGGDDEDTGGHDRQRHDVDGRDVAVISDTLHTLCDIISDIRSGIYVEGPAEILLDVNMAANNLHISDDLKTATWTREEQNRPETAERFQDYYQVISRRGFTSGRHYWDVEGNRSGRWRVGMCYPSIDRRGQQSYIGFNNKSWGLCRYNNNQYSVIHDSKEIRLPHKISSNRLRICLDYEAGQLSFYELCDPIRHLHTFTATFTEPLHAVLCIWAGSIKILVGGRNWEKPL
ncbi:uncharacterized protein LOC142204604 [Leptodactylus fuscus]|uniref:uncharacterized protein LOC142204604 n=1 Tax=Leptodactylus fuscus TaxID=238119 RepID=UPI003F4E7033